MDDFHYINLPAEIAIFAVSIIEFSTICNHTKSGREVRDSITLKPKRNYLLKNCYLSRQQFELFNSFFCARRGRRYGFLLKDYSDYLVNKQFISIINNDNDSFQLIKTYPDAISPYIREITKPIKNSVSLYINQRNNKIAQPLRGEIDFQSGARCKIRQNNL